MNTTPVETNPEILSLQKYFEIEDNKKDWRLFCKVCEKEWALTKTRIAPGSVLHLLNHARSHTVSSHKIGDSLPLVDRSPARLENRMKHQYSDGGRAEAGYKGYTGDCVVRAVAIATGIPYQEVYDALNLLAKSERPRSGRQRSNARTGTHTRTTDRFLRSVGWTWTPTMTIGSGCRVHLHADELPNGRLIVRISKHLSAVINGVVYDTHDPSRGGTRCVYGYWRPLQ